MKRIFLSILFVVFLVSCSSTVEENNDEQPIEPTLPEQQEEIIFSDPVEKQSPNTEYQPAFVGQTRVAGIKTSIDLRVEIVSDQLANPWGIVQLPNNDLIITQKQGTVVKIMNDNKVVVIDAIFPLMNTNGQGGLLDVAIDNDFLQNKTIYFTLSEQTDQGTHTAVAKGVFNDELTTINDIEIIYRALPSFDGEAHYGSRVVVDQNNNLFVSTGDRQSLQTRDNAQALDTAHGKILHITSDGSPVSINPWIDDDLAQPEVYALGFRNSQGLAIDPITGTLYASDMGPKGGDEINIVKAKENYGWPIIGYGIEYSGQPVGTGISEKEGLVQPLYYWDPSIAPSGIAFYHLNEVKEWENNLFVASLVQKHIARLLIRDGKVIGEERLLEDQDQRFRDVLVSIDGSIYAITDEGRLYHISKAD
jgi:glucose/arabinose dehydrogenase